MNKEEMLSKIIDSLEIQTAFFNPDKAPKKNINIQFTFNENSGVYKYYISIKNKTCELIAGDSKKSICEIITDIETWNKIGGNYISGKDAMKSGRLKIKGNFIFFILKFGKIFSGNIKWNVPDNIYIRQKAIGKIKNVLVLSCSPRTDNGATFLLTERLIDGMKSAGANVKTLFPGKMNLNSCIGCFKCWLEDKNQCIFHAQDDMKLIWEEYYKSDLLVWSTPIYFYYCSSIMKLIMDRLFVKYDPRFYITDKNTMTHPQRYQHTPLQFLLSVAGFDDRDVFKPLNETMQVFESHGGPKMIGELNISQSMSHLLTDYPSKNKDSVLNGLFKAGIELIAEKKINKTTKKMIEKKVYDRAMSISASNYFMNKMMKEKKFVWERNDK